jgi:ComF family protein
VKLVVQDIFLDFLSLFYPRYCLGCSGSLLKGEDIICTECLLEMPKTNFHKQAFNPLYERLSLRMPLKHAFAYYHFKKGGRVQQLLHQLKYKNHPEIGVKLGKVLAQELLVSGYDQTYHLVVPVPLHPSRKRSRGYNQSEEFAKGVSEGLNIPYTDSFVKRTVQTQTQTRKSKLNRWRNVSEVFEMKDTEAVKGKHILLVDDVVTTGATLEACANALLQSGCSQVSIACIAVA